MAETRSGNTEYGKKLQDALDRYFEECDGNGKRPTMRGFVKFSKELHGSNAKRSVETVERDINDYFTACEAIGDVPSESGLALTLKISVQTLRRWHDGEQNVEYQEFVQDAYARMTNIYMQLLLTGNKNMTPFVIFMLKQPRFAGYQDKIEAKQDIAVNVKMGKNMDESDWK